MTARDGVALLTAWKRDEQEAEQRPLDLGLIKRLFEFTRPYAAKRNALVVLVVIRSAQLACLAALLGWVIEDTITHRDPVRLAWGAGAYAALAISTVVVLHFRQRSRWARRWSTICAVTSSGTSSANRWHSTTRPSWGASSRA